MQERVIENWLTNANELSFTIPFAQVLALQGHRIVQIQPKRTTLEQGKDIITVDENSVVHCYQLKGDDISLSRWRSEVKVEVEVMMDIPPKHPSLGDDIDDWVCHLVVNGEFKGEATREVFDTQQERNRTGKRNFETIMRGDLLAMFKSAYGQYLPTDLEDFAAFLDLYNMDGRQPADKKALSRIILAALRSALEGDDAPSSNAMRQQVNAAIITMNYVLAGKYRSANHIAILESWLLLLGHIHAVAEKHNLADKYWRPAADLIGNLIDETIEDLLKELGQRTHYAEPAALPYADAYVYRPRVTIVAGYLAAYCVAARLGEGQHQIEDRVADFLTKTDDLLILWGEGAIPATMMVATFWHLRGDTPKASKQLLACVDAILSAYENGGLHDPYADLEEILRSNLQLTLRPLEKGAQGSSYLLEPLILTLAHLDQRQSIEERWRAITHVSQIQFKPSPVWQWFYWRCANGRHESRFLRQTQSWQKLQDLARTAEAAMLPTIFSHTPRWLPMFICVMPHRATTYAARRLMTALAALGDNIGQ